MPVPIATNKDGHVPLIASIDVGTTSSRVILFNRQGQEVCKHQIEYSTSASKEKYTYTGKRRFSEQKELQNSSSESSLQNGHSLADDIITEEPENDTPKRERSRNQLKPIFSSVGMKIEETEYLKIEDLNIHAHGPTLRYPQPGWVECNPMSILTHVVQCFGSALNSLDSLNITRQIHGLPLYKVYCIGIANMRETTIVWSKKSGLPVCEYGIVWNDSRNASIINEEKRTTSKEMQDMLMEKTGLPLSTYFSCSKLRWFLDNVPTVKKAYDEGDLMFGTVDTWLIYHLTKGNTFVSDATNASRTGFMNLDTLDYDRELFEFWDIDMEKINLPKIVSSAEYFGDFVIPQFVEKMVPKPILHQLQEFSSQNIPIQGCLGDQSASLVGQMAYKKGAAKCTYGTGCFLLYNTGTSRLASKHGALTTIGFWFPYLKDNDHGVNKPNFALEGSVAVAGAVVQWLRDNLRLFSRAEEVGPLASRVPDSGGVVFVPAFSGLFAPYWDADARATIMGMSQYTTASHIARAAVEGVCFQARAILKAMSSDAYEGEINDDIDLLEESNSGNYERAAFSVLAVDGGMSRSNEVMQIQADILGPCIKVRRSPVAESTALGAAIAANMAYKNEEDRILWKDLHDVKKWVFFNGYDKGEEIPEDQHQNLRVFEAEIPDEERRRHWKLWETAIQRSKGWLRDVQGEHTPVFEESREGIDDES
ncbi:hypothetical protein KAFR_0I01510 [Kazachstania africana CBS 2517]|uniref:glycerol kinase n=1 Tax=Kazachstania africana (strain ATCC 22294 / BCRC 22015 / CBS 2517 / CECT 1963 / NBRC 1671 / NRRL Y-8276) TaxID=1071382 RepID=H2AZY2_KAZAF|nr:hypothetical protein KAFR_0I01510 [Kazachstania africana CBS 2517]CCF59932.1 hypothetical protein KAFR_0I01510 [Kazachstania africana CBS 2517]